MRDLAQGERLGCRGWLQTRLDHVGLMVGRRCSCPKFMEHVLDCCMIYLTLV